MADPHEGAAHIPTGQALHTEDHDHDGAPTQKILAANSHESPSADTHHAKNHGAAEHPIMGRMELVRKTADETISLNQTVQDDDHLFFSIGANEVWVFQMYLNVNSGTVPDWKYNIGVPSGASGWSALITTLQNTVNHGTDSANVAQGGAERLVPIAGIVVNSTTAGTVQLKWAQNLLDAGNTSVLANSYLMAHRIA